MVRFPETRFVTVAPERFAPEISQPAIDIPVRSVFEIFALRSITDGPTMNPFRATYPVGSVAVVRFTRFPVITLVNVALVMTAFVIVDPVMVTPDKSIPVAAALVRFTLGPTINPPRTKYPAGSVVTVEPLVMPPVRIPVSVVFVKMALVTFVFVRIAFVKLAPDRSTPERSTPVKFWFERLAPRRMTRGPTMNPFRGTYPVGRVAVSRPVRLPVMIPERLVDAPLISVFVKFDPVSVIPPVRSMF